MYFCHMYSASESVQKSTMSTILGSQKHMADAVRERPVTKRW